MQTTRPNNLWIVALFMSVMSANALAGGTSFYSRSQEGWFWHEDPVILEEGSDLPECLEGEGSQFFDGMGLSHTALMLTDTGVFTINQYGQRAMIPYQAVQCDPPLANKPPEPAEPKEEEPKEELAEAPPAPAPPAGPAPLSVQWIKENLDRYKNDAIDDPKNTDKVRAYVLLQRYMMDKASAFTETYNEVVQGDPLLDETNRFPTATFAVNEFAREAMENGNAVIKSVSEKAGLFFFIGEDCVTCQKQASILKVFKDQHGMTVTPVTVGNVSIADNALGTPLRDTGQARAMGVVKLPAIIMAYPENGTFHNVSQGSALNLTNIKDRVLIGAKKLNIITQAEFDTTEPVKTQDLMLDKIPVDLLTEDILNDHAALVQILQAGGLK